MNSEGTETARIGLILFRMFESSVNSEGTETTALTAPSRTGLRVV